MRLKMLFCAVALASVAYAKEPAPYLTGTLVQMEAVYCGASDSAQRESTNLFARNTFCRQKM